MNRLDIRWRVAQLSSGVCFLFPENKKRMPHPSFFEGWDAMLLVR